MVSYVSVVWRHALLLQAALESVLGALGLADLMRAAAEQRDRVAPLIGDRHFIYTAAPGSPTLDGNRRQLIAALRGRKEIDGCGSRDDGAAV